MPFATFAAGPYTANYNADNASGNPPGKGAGSRDLGLVEGVRRWQRTMQARPVEADAFGSMEIDGIYQGGRCFVSMTFKEWTTAVKDALWPFGTFGDVGQIGIFLSELAGELTLTAAADTPAAATGPATLIFGKAIIAPDHNSEVVLGHQQRDVAVVFRCLPYINNQGNIVWFEES